MIKPKIYLLVLSKNFLPAKDVLTFKFLPATVGGPAQDYLLTVSR